LKNETIKLALAEHHSSQAYRPQAEYPNVVNANGQYLGPYIPYMGEIYFNSKPRVLIYAMSQNLGRASSLVKKWATTPDQGLLRHYLDETTPHIHIHPYDDGHLKIIAALTLCSYPGTSFDPTKSIDHLVAVTNFVKFSFYRESRNSSWVDANPPREIYNVMWKCYSSYEVEVLRPDIIICAGNDVANALVKGLKEAGKRNIVVKIPFPGRLNLNSRWVPKGKELIKTGRYDPEPFKAKLVSLLRGTPDKKGLIRRSIETDWYFFMEMKRYIAERVAQLI